MKTIQWDGKPISQPGMYRGVPLEIYHGNCCVGPSISSTGLRKIVHESPRHFWAESYLNDRRRTSEARKHFSLGRAVHHLILGEAYFDRLFVIRPETYTDKNGEIKAWSGNAEVCRAWARAQAKGGREVITPADAECIKEMAIALSQHESVKAGILRGLIERSLFLRDPETGIWLKWRPDVIPNASGDVADLKTTTSVLWKDLVKSIDNFAYYQQGALGRLMMRELFGVPMATFSLVFVEKNEPFCCRTVILKDHMLDRGEKLNRIALQTMRRCLDSGNWPGPGGERDIAEHIETSEASIRRIDDIINRATDDGGDF